MVSVIVPVYNEEPVLTRHADYFRRMGQRTDLIFVDGGSTDQSRGIAARFGRVVDQEKGRARQMNAGAAVAREDVLVFLHADTRLSPAALGYVSTEWKAGNRVGGCFRQRLDEPGWMYRWIAWTGNLRAACTGIYYGDQGIVVRKAVFRDLGGFPDVPICEDVLFSQQLRNAGRVGMLPYDIVGSARRWKAQGILKTFWMNQRVYRALRRHEDLAAMARAYRDVREENHEEPIPMAVGRNPIVARDR